jgi:2-hydroxychromene-2-carboxylate isomerase
MADMKHTVDLFWSFRSPYSYLALPRLLAMQTDWALQINIRPVYPIALRQPDFFNREQPGWMHYLLTDVLRLAEYLDIPIALPNPDPVVMDPETGRAADQQPHIHRLTRLGVAASQTEHGLAFLHALSSRIWSGDDWSVPGVLEAATAEAGLDLADLEAKIEADPAACDAAIALNGKALLEAGHWGVPTLTVEGEPFFGQDRIELALWRLKQRGLQPRLETV